MIREIEHREVCELRLDRPPANALSPELLAALAERVRDAGGEGERALVLSGSPGLFTGGLDIPYLVELDRPRLEQALEVFFDAMEVLAACPIPVAAAITGHCPAGGLVLALFCDWRVMAEGPFGIGLNEVTIGIPMPAVVAAVLARAVGRRRAESLCVTGRLLAPSEALAAGVVDEVVGPEGVVERACDWCRTVVSSPARALSATRRTLRRDLIETVDRYREADIARLAEEWFRPEIQRPLAALVARLKG